MNKRTPHNTLFHSTTSSFHFTIPAADVRSSNVCNYMTCAIASVATSSSCSRRRDETDPAKRRSSLSQRRLSTHALHERIHEKNESVAVELPFVPDGGADGPDESWFPAGAAGEGGVGEGGDAGACAGASPRAEQPLPKKPERQPMQRRNESSPSTYSDIYR